MHNLLMGDDFIVKGIKGIKKVYTSERKVFLEDDTGCISKNKQDEQIIETEGANMKEIMAIDQIDYTRVLSNDI